MKNAVVLSNLLCLVKTQVLDGNSEYDAHVWRNEKNQITYLSQTEQMP